MQQGIDDSVAGVEEEESPTIKSPTGDTSWAEQIRQFTIYFDEP